jgi:hypothetical protein
MFWPAPCDLPLLCVTETLPHLNGKFMTSRNLACMMAMNNVISAGR